MSLGYILKKNSLQIAISFLLILVEAIAMLFMPLFIGYAINDLLDTNFRGIWQLASLGICIVVLGMLRRFFDSRIYANIYVKLSGKMIEANSKSTTSKLTARISMLRELVDFLENYLPELFINLIGLLGTLTVLYTLNFNIFLGCLTTFTLMFLIFLFSGKYTKSINYHYNNILEKQVSVVESRNDKLVANHIKKLMKWNIKLSDLEALIFGIIWLGMILLIVYAIIEAVSLGTLEIGIIMSIIMYVFQFAEDSGMLPLYYQEFLRLKEISERLKN